MTDKEIPEEKLHIYETYADQIQMTEEDVKRLDELDMLTSDEDADEGGGHTY